MTLLQQFTGIGLDIDGVLIEDRSLLFIAWLEENGYIRLGGRERFMATNSWQIATGLSSEVRGVLYGLFEEALGSTLADPITGAHGALQQLQPWCNLHTITARDALVQERTIAHLHWHFGPTCFTSHHFGWVGSKDQIAQQLGIRVHIDDSIHEARRIAEIGIKVILFPQPVNMNASKESHSNIIHLAVGRSLTADMSEADWQRVEQEAWAEIPLLLAELIQSGMVQRQSVKCT